MFINVFNAKKAVSLRNSFKCLEPESNQWHEDFQSSALPTELSRLSSGDRIWTCDLRVMSPTSFQTAPSRDKCYLLKRRMGRGGFEPPKQVAADLQSVPFGHSGIHPYGIVFHKADDRTRTDNLLITNQLLCQLSHIGMWLSSWFVTSCSAYNWLVPPQLSRIEPHRH